MSSSTVAYPNNLQTQSRLVQLPQEIKSLIFNLCFTTDGAVVDPSPNKSPANGHVARRMGVNLLQTCRTLYHETDRRSLFTQNTFRFRTVDGASTFLRSLDPVHSACIYDIEIDAQSMQANHPGLAREWLHYLAWGNGQWDKALGSLHVDAPGLKCLRLNFESWPKIAMKRAELWNQLRNMLSKVEGLERVVVKGASKGTAMAKRAPFSPLHFVGGDDVGFDDLVPRMWSAVGAANESKIVRWARQDGKLELEVVSMSHLLEHLDPYWYGPSVRRSHTHPWPENGSCTWFGYENRDSDVTDPTTKGLNPSAAE
ncbi:uncharacterized protein EKO05_0004490 [Ascochyta rabiei]|uniref:Uncharacterized protein n=1 Tax=Didymella rabiei TaxID=5454 RepID=A0A163DPL1_DIDRA|nr:uncharacterized protein EKO05_0004490 [Ascochyta rabiei]KZM23291.1 hypothetical protein ST47_g5560 [Ascochyta rabiei]UPX13997.1 hypothetical protein EKO05_0004490 [Ascochyta rabiei]